jgi:hypothetical protein
VPECGAAIPLEADMRWRFWIRAVVVVLVALVEPAQATAQAGSGDAAPAIKRFDATAYLAWFGADRGGVGGDTYRDWFSTSLAGAAVGHYWTEHLKTEVEYSATGEDRLTSVQQELLDSRTTAYTYRNHYYRFRTITVLQSWQFLHNAWVHPFVGAGVDVIRESRRVEGRRQIVISSPIGQPGFGSETLPESHEASVVTHLVLATGFKAYFARHGFFRTDLRGGIGSGLDEFTWRFGVGLDF